MDNYNHVAKPTDVNNVTDPDAEFQCCSTIFFLIYV